MEATITQNVMRYKPSLAIQLLCATEKGPTEAGPFESD
jgi:hypothetical protein